jgi:hypothetical protein
MHAGRATSLAEHGVPPAIIQPLGKWSSAAFLIYIRKSPVLIQAMLYSDRRTPSLTERQSTPSTSLSCSTSTSHHSTLAPNFGF